MKIDSFRGMNYFLSNFYESPVTYEGITYRNNEAAFQAQKTLDENKRICFSSMSASDAKRAGRRVSLRPDWESVKYEKMLGIVYAKFAGNAELKAKLLATGDAELEEGNTWGDRTWGTVNGVGKNWLGKILMEVRDALKNERS